MMGKSNTPAWLIDRPWLSDAVILDGLLPWAKTFLPQGASLAQQLARFHTAGFDHISLTAAANNEGPVEALARLGFIASELAAGGVCVAHDANGIRAAKRAGKISVSFHFQSTTPFAPDLDLVDGFKAAGIQRAILAYNEANVFADGCHEPRNGGLTAMGRRLIERMDRAGMIVDLSHCGERTTFDAMKMSLSRPPIFSHSNARALFDHERNISDEQIRTCARRGGYIGVNGVGMFLGVAAPDIPAAIARHAAHIASIAGTDRVGLGLDFMYLEGSDYAFYHVNAHRWPRGYPSPPWDFIQSEQLGHLVAALETEGFDKNEVRGILGENYLRHSVA